MEPSFVGSYLERNPTEEGAATGQDRKSSGGDLGASVPAPSASLRTKRPDYRAEKLLKHLPGNEKEMDRYVERFLTKYNSSVSPTSDLLSV